MKVMTTPRALDLDITSRCNMRCSYCYHFSGPGDVEQDLPTDAWLAFFEELGRCGVMHVALAGGEPFLRSDLEELLAGIAAHRMRFSILSNGSLITDARARFLSTTRRCDGVQVSIDGSGPHTHDVCRGPGSFSKALAGIRCLQRHGVPVMVRVTIHRFNVEDLGSIAALLLDDLGLPGFTTNSVGHLGLCRQDAQRVGLRASERTRAMNALLRLKRTYGDRISATAGPLEEACAWMRMENARRAGTARFAGGGYLSGCGCVRERMAVRADGVMVPCTMLSHMELGRINRDRLKDIWQHHPQMEAMRRRITIPLKKFALCRECSYGDYCTGNCPAQAYALTGQVHHPSPDACLKQFLEDGGILPEVAWLAAAPRERVLSALGSVP